MSTLWNFDPELYTLLYHEKRRQIKSLNLIASENFTSVPVIQCLSSSLQNKYSEGYPGRRYYGGNDIIDQIEKLTWKRCLQTFHLNENHWCVNVQPYSGSSANLAVLMALIPPHGRIMGLDLPDGGHLSHGYSFLRKRLTASSMFYESMPYKLNPETNLIDYDKLEEMANLFRPNVIIAGTSCYSRCLDYKRFREIANQHNAFLFSDMAHVAGLVAAKVIPSPFEYSDVVTMTTQKTFRGPRAGIIFFKKDLNTQINGAVFPGLQGGPHNNQIAGIATAMRHASTDEFRNYQKQVVKNARRLCSRLMEAGYNVVTGGTDVHLILVDLRNKDITGAHAEYVLDKVDITCNKNMVPGDKNAFTPSGIRLGTAALTTRGLVENDIDKVVHFIDRSLEIGRQAQRTSGVKINNFKNVLNIFFIQEILSIKAEVNAFAKALYMPGLSDI